LTTPTRTPRIAAMARDDDDRRRHPRVRLDGRTGGRATVFADFKMATPLAVDSQCDITLNLAHVTVDLRGRVVDVEQPSSASPVYHVGVSFVKVDALDRALLESFLDRERQRAGA
jgi:hypothetical protein